ncbi:MULTISPECIES: winged helix-turn-helix transcriptional regulator [Gordonia]|nr:MULTISPECIES: winged helix-turn-helix transcriptional regulator [unclassified Gordonia (in: high G+C Gram-positive bacteria)]MCX2752464.1 winged helix-turn-helix transcriptional regulator [Gordonia sp. 4N]SCB87713.1 transcriptional regulator, HxlR family [Gordonia sp. v-85]
MHREVYQEVPPRVVYSLTPKGAARDRALAPLGDWGEEHMQTITAARR